jgi:hypothetical protein
MSNTNFYKIMAQYHLCGDLRIDPLSVISGKLDDAESKLRVMIEDALKVPDGWKLVPVEPTTEMLEAGVEENLGRDMEVCIYKAMLSSAPTYEDKPCK